MTTVNLSYTTLSGSSTRLPNLGSDSTDIRARNLSVGGFDIQDLLNLKADITYIDNKLQTLKPKNLFLQVDETDDTLVSISRDSADNLILADPNAGALKLSDLAINTPEQIKAILGYTPANIAGDTFTGDLIASKRLELAAHANNVGLQLPVSSGPPTPVASQKVGDIVYDSSSKKVYVADSLSTFKDIAEGGAVPGMAPIYIESYNADYLEPGDFAFFLDSTYGLPLPWYAHAETEILPLGFVVEKYSTTHAKIQIGGFMDIIEFEDLLGNVGMWFDWDTFTYGDAYFSPFEGGVVSRGSGVSNPMYFIGTVIGAVGDTPEGIYFNFGAQPPGLLSAINKIQSQSRTLISYTPPPFTLTTTYGLVPGGEISTELLQEAYAIKISHNFTNPGSIRYRLGYASPTSGSGTPGSYTWMWEDISIPQNEGGASNWLPLPAEIKEGSSTKYLRIEALDTTSQRTNFSFNWLRVHLSPSGSAGI